SFVGFPMCRGHRAVGMDDMNSPVAVRLRLVHIVVVVLQYMCAGMTKKHLLDSPNVLHGREHHPHPSEILHPVQLCMWESKEFLSIEGRRLSRCATNAPGTSLTYRRTRVCHVFIGYPCAERHALATAVASALAAGVASGSRSTLPALRI